MLTGCLRHPLSAGFSKARQTFFKHSRVGFREFLIGPAIDADLKALRTNHPLDDMPAFYLSQGNNAAIFHWRVISRARNASQAMAKGIQPECCRRVCGQLPCRG